MTENLVTDEEYCAAVAAAQAVPFCEVYNYPKKEPIPAATISASRVKDMIGELHAIRDLTKPDQHEMRFLLDEFLAEFLVLTVRPLTVSEEV